MEKSVSEARAECVRYYEDKTYSHEHAEAHVPHDADQIMRVYHAIQEEKKLPPKTEQNTPCFWIDSEAGGFPMSRSKWNRTDLGKVD